MGADVDPGRAGAGLAEITSPLIILVVFAVGFFWLAVRQYHKRTA